MSTNSPCLGVFYIIWKACACTCEHILVSGCMHPSVIFVHQSNQVMYCDAIRIRVLFIQIPPRRLNNSLPGTGIYVCSRNMIKIHLFVAGFHSLLPRIFQLTMYLYLELCNFLTNEWICLGDSKKRRKYISRHLKEISSHLISGWRALHCVNKTVFNIVQMLVLN